MKILLEDGWNADDIIEECKKRNIICEIYSSEELQNMDNTEFMNNITFCDTMIMEEQINRSKVIYKIPDTYDSRIEKMLNRKILLCEYKNIFDQKFPIFIKSYGNNKKLSGTVVQNIDELKILFYDNEIEDGEFYCCNEIITFDVEYRLFIGDGKLYAYGCHSGNSEIKLDIDFAKNIAKHINDFMVVDIGLYNNKWIVVEVNPPYSIDDCGIDISTYLDYCIDAQLMIKELNKFF
jgi:hypothetical protein